MTIDVGMTATEAVSHLTQLTEQLDAALTTFPAQLHQSPATLRRAAWARGLHVTRAADGQNLDYLGRRASRVYAELMMPVDAPGWMAQLATDDSAAEDFWQRIDQVEGEGDRLAFHFDLALAPPLARHPALELVREVLLRQLVSRGCPVDLAIHAPSGQPAVAHVLFVVRDPARMAAPVYPEAIATRPTRAG